MEGWRSIDTAPKNGELIFIKERGGRVQVAKWCSRGYDIDWHVQLTQCSTDNTYPTSGVEYWMPIPTTGEDDDRSRT